LHDRSPGRLFPQELPLIPKVSTLKLFAGALNENVEAGLIELVTGETALGLVGLLLAVAAPVRTSAVPVDEMPENGSWKVIV
jgi:hypothetical protein